MIEAGVMVAGSGNITGLHVIRALMNDVDNLVGYDCCPQEQNAANLFCHNESVPRAFEKDYVSSVLELARKHNSRFVIASNDHDVRALAVHRNVFAKDGIVINAVTDDTLGFLDKLETVGLFQRSGIPTPDLLQSPMTPCVIRKRFVGSSKKFVHVVRSMSEMPSLSEHDLDDSVCTRFVPGDEFTIDLLASRGSSLAIVPRLRREVRHGMVHFGEIVKDEQVIELTKKLAFERSLDGMYCIQCIKNDTGCFFFEVNARPGSGLDLTIAAGINMPLMWLNQKLGHNVVPKEPEWGLKLIRYHAGYYFR